MTTNTRRVVLIFYALHICLSDASTVIRPTDTVYVHPGESASFVCEVSWGLNYMHSIFWGWSDDGGVWTLIAECWGVDGKCDIVEEFKDTYYTESVSSRNDYFQLDVLSATLKEDGHYECWLYAVDKPTSPHARLVVLDQINHLVITCYNYDAVVTVKAGVPHLSTCVAMCGNPPATLMWSVGGRDVTEYSHESSSENYEDGRQYDTGSQLMYRYNASDDQVYLECTGFQHEDLEVRSFRVILNVEHAPIISEIMVNSWTSDHMVEVECMATANPAKITYAWTSSDGQTGEGKTWIMEDVDQNDQVTVTCVAANSEGTASSTETLYRLYAPEIDEIAVLSWSADDDVEVECVATANPPDIAYSWRSDDGQTGGDSRTWQLRDTDQDNFVTVTCNASNTEGTTSHTQTLYGRAAPVIYEIAELSWGDDHMVEVECVAKARPDDITYAWRSTGQAGGNTRIWDVEDVDQDGVVTVTCVASNVEGVNSLTETLYKHYAPVIQDITHTSWTSDHMVEVECTATAYPANITYAWTSSDGQTGEGKTWIMEDVDQDDQVTVTCVAANSEGSSSLTETLHNLYPPTIHEIDVLSWGDDHMVEVECVATANPDNITYAWRSDYQVGGNTRIWIVEDGDQDGVVTVTCKATNQEGEAVAMETLSKEYSPIVEDITSLSWIDNWAEVECHATANPENITYSWVSGGNQTGSGKIWFVEDVDGVGYVSLTCRASNLIGSDYLMTTLYNSENEMSSGVNSSQAPVSAISITTSLVLLVLLSVFILLWRRAVIKRRAATTNRRQSIVDQDIDSDRRLMEGDDVSDMAPPVQVRNPTYDADEVHNLY